MARKEDKRERLARTHRLYTTGWRGPTRTAVSERCGPKETADGCQNLRPIRAYGGGFREYGHGPAYIQN